MYKAYALPSPYPTFRLETKRPGWASTSPYTSSMEAPTETSAHCVDCGHPITPDPLGSEGVWVHNSEVLGDEAYDLNEEHAARPPEDTDF